MDSTSTSSRASARPLGFDTVEAETKDIEGIRVNVATPAALYRLKKGTIRAKDYQDAAALRERFNLTDEEDSTCRARNSASIEAMNAAAPRARPRRPRASSSIASCYNARATGRLRQELDPRGVFKFRSIEDAQRARAHH